MHIGASETLVGFLAIFQAATATAGQPPGAGCISCIDLIALTPVRLPIEQQIRQEILNMLRTQRASLLAAGVEASTLAAFELNETCQLSGIRCVEQCYNGSTSLVGTCKRTCNVRLQDCLH
jgi:hypothetical protein